MGWAENEALRELNDPNTPYYLGNPSPLNQVRNYLNGFGGGTYRTNYFGANASRYLAPRKYDSFEVLDSTRKRNEFNNLLAKIGLGSAAVLGLLIARKIPGVNLIFPAIGGCLSGIGHAIGWVFKSIGKLIK